MTAVSLVHYLILAAVLFVIGLIGLMVRRNIIVLFMCIEIMLNSANITILAYARQYNDASFQSAALFVITIAVCEAAAGLALVIAIFKRKETVLADGLDSLKG